MITDSDVKKLSKAFATKKDLSRFATKDDLDKKLKPIRTKIDTLDTKMDNMKSSIDVLVDATGNILEWTDDIHRAIVGTHKKSVSDS